MRLFISTLLFLTSTLLHAQISSSFVELDDPQKPAGWENVSSGLHVSFASIDERFPKSVAPKLNLQRSHKLTAWRGEKVSAQILIWSKEIHKSLRLQASALKGNQSSLPSDLVQFRFVRYVMTDEFSDGCGHRKPENFAASLSPDMLDDLEEMDLEAKTVRPVWVSIEVPADAKPGNYAGKVLLKGKSVLDIELEILDRILPPPSEWSYHLDQWQHPSAVARVNNVPLWSDAHFEALKPVMSLAAKAGQKVITATLNKDPWNVQTFDPYADMIIWEKKADGTWAYDYKVFDRWVQFMLDLGIKKMINCYSIIPWNNEIHYLDGGQWVNVKAEPGTPIFEELWSPFLKDFVQHLRERGWLEITNIAMDERTRVQMDAAFQLLQKVAPELGVAYADNHKTYQRYPNTKDVSISIGHPYEEKDLRDRTSRGLITTFYICCSDAFPNQFTFSQPAESTYLAWYAEATGFNGMLRWAFNSWVEHPLQDSRFRTWPAGDTYIIYPQGRSSVRYERLVEGIQDYEKIQILKKTLERDKLVELQKAIVPFKAANRFEGWNEKLNTAKKLLNQLSK
ncbi:glycoside hydrolase domain-containing protein [Leadbetterella byssophila]|uniref:DUF4091 domain-containing protein n=1 Tax=Leadbetterella byssophila TaxID=316068 RepID=UPI0039A3071E